MLVILQSLPWVVEKENKGNENSSAYPAAPLLVLTPRYVPCPKTFEDLYYILNPRLNHV